MIYFSYGIVNSSENNLYKKLDERGASSSESINSISSANSQNYNTNSINTNTLSN